MNAEPEKQESRRSTRIRAKIPLRLTCLEPGIEFSEACHTLVVNAQGCGVCLSRPVEAGIAVRLEELPVGASATARVAHCIPLGNDGKYWIAGVALDQAANVWGIDPAPADWTIPNAAAPAPAPVARRKISQWPYSVFSKQGIAKSGGKQFPAGSKQMPSK
ncbi:MAG: hypothetical protein JOY93_11290 [Acidobacteriales bacterium]|nr:hypothetical protein [Terriglobales bacterium]